MIYLNKTNQAAIQFVSNFISLNWLEQNDGSYKYQNIGFSNIKNPAEEFRNFFISEQGNKCCYCCRNIENKPSSTELEHIIPHSKTMLNEFEQYYSLSDILRNNVVPQNIFETGQ